jgi:plasmid stabilization system protein ParE
MKRWTPEAEQRLDDYLEEIVALARSSGEADEDFVEELRQHIRSDAEESAGGVVTPQNLERALAAAGKPRDVLGMETESQGNGNGHGSPRADEASEGNVSRPYVVRSAKPLLKVRLILGGIVLPSLAICMEFFLLTVSGGGGVGVMPTLMHVLMIALVPFSVWYLIARSDPGADMASERYRGRIAAVLGYLYRAP